MAYKRNKSTSEEVKALIKDGRKKFVRIDEGAVLYSLGIHTFHNLAKDAGAIYHVRKNVLVNIDIMDEYMELFRDEL